MAHLGDKLAALLGRVLAPRLVDDQYVLSHYPDLAASGVNPVLFFAENWHREPVRSPNARFEALLFVVAPVVAVLLHLADRDRQDWLDCLRKRIIDLSCTGQTLQHALALASARFIAERLQRRPARSCRLHGGGLGTTVPVVAMGPNGPPGGGLDIVAEAGVYAFLEPRAVNDPRPARAREVERPALWSATVPNASIFGFSQVLSNGSLVCYEPAAHPAFKFVARQAEFVIHCYPPRQSKVLARIPDTVDHALDEAILLGGRCGANYYHFLIEYLTRGFVIEKIPYGDDIPIIVSEEMFPQEYEALRIALPGRKVFRRRHATRLDVRRLHIPAIMTYLPDSGEVPFWETAAVNHDSLAWLRARVLAHPDVRGVRTGGTQRIYLARSGARSIGNALEVEDAFVRSGFTIVDPSRLTFVEQVRLFSEASVVAGPMGAAFANLIFASAGTTVIILSSPFLTRFPIFASLAAFSGCHYNVIAGRHVKFRPGMEDDRQPLNVTHSDYDVDLNDIYEVLMSRLTLD